LGEISNESAFSAELNNPPIVLCESNHNGKLKPVGSFLSIDSESVSLTVLKKSEDENYTIIRGVECAGRAQQIQIAFMGTAYELEIGAYEIFTARIDGENIKKVNMLEESDRFDS
jgi:alpha-mannosidase